MTTAIASTCVSWVVRDPHANAVISTPSILSATNKTVGGLWVSVDMTSRLGGREKEREGGKMRGREGGRERGRERGREGEREGEGGRKRGREGK